MKKDPVLDEIQRVRRQIQAEFPNLKDYLDYLREFEKKHPERMLREPAHKIGPIKKRPRKEPIPRSVKKPLSTLDEIKQAIETLPKRDLNRLRKWIENKDRGKGES